MANEITRNLIASIAITDTHFNTMSRKFTNRVALEYGSWNDNSPVLEIRQEFLDKEGNYKSCAKDANYRIGSKQELRALIKALKEIEKDAKIMAELPESVEVVETVAVPKKDEMVSALADIGLTPAELLELAAAKRAEKLAKETDMQDAMQDAIFNPPQTATVKTGKPKK